MKHSYLDLLIALCFQMTMALVMIGCGVVICSRKLSRVREGGQPGREDLANWN